jgi:dienelactone hydrolase
MGQRYQTWMHAWENRLNARDTNRVVRPLEWGLEWTRQWPCADGISKAEGGSATPEAVLHELNHRILADSDSFFTFRTPTDFRLEPVGNGDSALRFTSPVQTPHTSNNTANARWFPARGRRAVVVLPQWNADAESHNSLCRIFNVLGIAALRLSLPYHDVRKPPETERADYAVSSNVGRTIDAARQAILETRCCLDWLESRGYSEFGVMGTSLGSCYAFIASAHEPRLKVNVFNHASTYFADVVWTGQSTRHIREGIEREVTLDSLRQAWSAISPMCYFDRFQRFPKKSLIVYATYDLTFLPEFSRQIAGEFRRRRLDHKIAVLPCGHYTTGETPYKFLDAWHIARFLKSAF